ncbi:hypothetical protein [Ascidiimonas sp. W6]|uniref:hypothetical protein n=1 Tax=Ascidiimonas meishanensis TaxID=3128903 RepID=UPI0030EDE6DE
MKKKSIKSLQLNKKSVANLNINGGNSETDIQELTLQRTICLFCVTNITCPSWQTCGATQCDICQA